MVISDCQIIYYKNSPLICKLNLYICRSAAQSTCFSFFLWSSCLILCRAPSEPGPPWCPPRKHMCMTSQDSTIKLCVCVYLEATSFIWTLLMRDVQLNSNSNMKFTWEKRGSWEKHWSMNQNGSVTVVMNRDDKPFFFQTLTFVWERNTG